MCVCETKLILKQNSVKLLGGGGSTWGGRIRSRFDSIFQGTASLPQIEINAKEAQLKRPLSPSRFKGAQLFCYSIFPAKGEFSEKLLLITVAYPFCIAVHLLNACTITLSLQIIPVRCNNQCFVMDVSIFIP